MKLAKGDTVYLADGTKCEYGSQVYGGKHLVYVLSRLHEDAEADLIASPQIVEEIYPMPPIAEKDKRIRELDDLISDKVTRLIRIQEELRQAEYQKQDLAKHIVRTEALRHVLDFLEGRIKFLVVKQSNEYDIRTLDDYLQNTDHTVRQPGFKLLALFGNLKKELSWGMNEYSDGSGIYTKVWPFYTLETARDFLVKHVEEEVDHDLKHLRIHWLMVHERTYNRLNKLYGFGLKLPEAAVAAIRKQRQLDAKKELEQINLKSAELKSLLSSLEPPE